MLRIPFIIVMIAVVIAAADEFETKKTVKKSSAIKEEDVEMPITDSAEAQTIAIEILKESTTASPTTVSAKTVSPTTASPTTVSPTTIYTQPTTTEKLIESTTVAKESTTAAAVESTTVPEAVSSTSEAIPSVPEISFVAEVESAYESPESEEDLLPDLDNILPLSETPRRKIIYINQQQNGKLNVQLELSDVSVIVIPSQNDPQLSLLNLLFRSAQKSSQSNDAKKKEENANANDQHDDYPQYKQSIRGSEENFNNVGAPIMPMIESRIPYKVDISSSLGQQFQPAVEIMPNSHLTLNPTAEQQFQPQFARVPIMQLLKPIPYAIHAASGQKPQSNRIFKRSIDSRLLGITANIPHDGENNVNYNDDELTESVFNSLDSEEDFNTFDNQNDSEFVLLGAAENCGPGRKRNSYQICVAVDDMK